MNETIKTYTYKEIEVTLRLFEEPHAPWSNNWELTNERLYVTSNHDGGYTTKGNAKRAALRMAEALGLTITDMEDNT